MAIIVEDWRIELVVLVSAIFFFIYQKLSSIYRYFEERNIPYIKGTFPVGSDVDQAWLRKSVCISIDKMYCKMKHENLFGIYLGISPFLVIRNPEFIHKILVTDFEYFHDRNFVADEKVNPLEDHLFFMIGNRWKTVRSLLTPAFTSGKLKFMFPEMKKCNDIFIRHLDEIVAGQDVDMKVFLERFTVDVIASTAFGLEPESVANPENKFLQMGKKFFNPAKWFYFVVFLRFAFPKLVLKLKLKSNPSDINEFFIPLFLKVIEERRKSGIVRQDFVQILLEMKNKGFVEINLKKEDKSSENIENIELTDILLAAQAFVFFLAGFETTSECLMFVLYSLSKNKLVQDRVRKEVLQVKQKYGEFTYEAIKEMNYLEKCMSETIRLYPPVPMLNRKCTKDYTFPDGTKVEEGMSIYIPVFSIQRDPEHFNDPLLFNPERVENSSKAWIAFGDGPRHCIGKRYALTEVKMLLASMLEKYSFEESKLTKEPLEFAPTIPLKSVNPLYVKVSKING